MKLWKQILLLSATISCGEYLKNDEESGWVKDPKIEKEFNQEKVKSLELFDTLVVGIDTYENCDALQQQVYQHEQIKAQSDYLKDLYYGQRFYRGYEEAQYSERAPTVQEDSSPAGKASSQEDDILTNIQEQGVDEADFIKVSEEQIIVMDKNKLMVTDRDTLSYVGSLEMKNIKDPISYILKNKLVVIGKRNFYNNIPYLKISSMNNDQPSYYDTSTVHVSIFQLEKSKLPLLIEEKDFTGTYIDSRMQEEKLILVMSDQLQFVDNWKTYENIVGKYNTVTKSTVSENPLLIKNDSISGIPCNQIVKKPNIDYSYQLTKINKIDINSKDLITNSTAVLGSATTVYMSAKNLYFIDNTSIWSPWKQPKSDTSASYDWNYYYRESPSVIYKVNVSEESPTIVASGLVMGFAKNQYFFKEYSDESFLVATTTQQSLHSNLKTTREGLIHSINENEFSQSKENVGRNHLWALRQKDQKLEIVKVEKNFGEPNEDIRSVRFTDEFAYVVTFEKTDPLFTFNTKEPANFKLVGKLKIPGFSTYMHPINDSKLVGIGFDADDQGDFSFFQGIQVSLFDVSNPEETERVDQVILGVRGSSSEVTHDPHAFFYDKNNNIFAIPMIELQRKLSDEPYSYGSQLEFSGAIFYSVEDKELVEKGRVSHFNFIPEECKSQLESQQWWENKNRSLDVNRIFLLDDHYITISQYGIKQFAVENLEKPQKEVDFKNLDCNSYWYY